MVRAADRETATRFGGLPTGFEAVALDVVDQGARVRQGTGPPGCARASGQCCRRGVGRARRAGPRVRNQAYHPRGSLRGLGGVAAQEQDRPMGEVRALAVPARGGEAEGCVQRPPLAQGMLLDSTAGVHANSQVEECRSGRCVPRNLRSPECLESAADVAHAPALPFPNPFPACRDDDVLERAVVQRRPTQNARVQPGLDRDLNTPLCHPSSSVAGDANGRGSLTAGRYENSTVPPWDTKAAEMAVRSFASAGRRCQSPRNCGMSGMTIV